MKSNQTNPMRKKKTSLRILRKDLENTRGSYLSDASIVEKLHFYSKCL
jgi:hypothetical protein